MIVTAFTFIGQIERAAQSYLASSRVFAKQSVSVDRLVDFRRGSAGLQFFLEGADEDQPMGSIHVETVQDSEAEQKVAFKVYITAFPLGQEKQFFVLLRRDRESYVQPGNVFEALQKYWDADPHVFFADGWEPALGTASSSGSEEEDEYDSLSPEEIEAITGERPKGKNEPATAEDEDSAMIESTPVTESNLPENLDDLSVDEIESLLARAEGQKESSGLGQDDVDSIAQSVSPELQEEAEEEPEMSAEDIWKQISGKPQKTEKKAVGETPEESQG